MTRVLFVYRYCTRGGVETGLRFRLAHLPAHGIEPHVLFLEDYGGRAAFAEFDGRVFVEPGAEGIARLIRAHSYDVVSIIDTFEVLDWLSAAGYAGKVMLELRSTYEHTLVNLRALGKARVDALLTPSEYQAKAVRAYFPRGWRADLPVHVVPNTIDIDAFRSGAAGAPRAPRPILLWVGRLDRLKNWEDFLAIGQRVAEQTPVDLWMVGGSGAEEPELVRFRQALKDHPMATRLSWWPAVPSRAMPRVYGCVAASGGATLVTSRNESFGFVALEALACGCPVAAAAVGGVPEVLADGQGGLLYTSGNVSEAADRTVRLLTDMALRQRLLDAAALEIPRRFAPPACAALHARVLHTLAEAGQTAGHTGS